MVPLSYLTPSVCDRVFHDLDRVRHGRVRNRVAFTHTVHVTMARPQPRPSSWLRGASIVGHLFATTLSGPPIERHNTISPRRRDCVEPAGGQIVTAGRRCARSLRRCAKRRGVHWRNVAPSSIRARQQYSGRWSHERVGQTVTERYLRQRSIDINLTGVVGHKCRDGNPPDRRGWADR